MNLNKAFVLGNLTRDPEKRALPSGQSVVNFGVATNRYYLDQSGQRQSEAEFHNIVLFGKLADIASTYLKKGALVLIEGRIRTNSWQDTSGIKRSKTEIIGEKIQLGPKNYPSSAGYSPTQSIKSSSQKIQEEEIPIIEEPNNKEKESKSEDKESPFIDENNDEIDINEIPF